MALHGNETLALHRYNRTLLLVRIVPETEIPRASAIQRAIEMEFSAVRIE